MISTRFTHGLAALGFGVFCLAAVPLAAQEAATAPAAPADLNETLDARPAFANGEEAWNKVCARCHVPGVGPDLSINEYDADTLRYFVRNGYLAMPSFPESAIDDVTIDDLAVYLAANVYKGNAQ